LQTGDKIRAYNILSGHFYRNTLIWNRSTGVKIDICTEGLALVPVSPVYNRF